MNNKILYDKITKILSNEDKQPMVTLEQIKKELETEIITDGKINNSIKQAFKRLQKENSIRTRFQNVLVNDNNNYTITNSYFLITYTQEQLPKELKAFIDQTKDNMYADFQFEKFKNNDGENGSGEMSKISVDFNSLLKIYKYNKINKLQNTFTLQNGFTFNLQYLLDILALLNEKDLQNVELEISEHIHRPMNIYSKNGKAILLPIRMTEEQIERQLELQRKIIKGE